MSAQKWLWLQRIRPWRRSRRKTCASTAICYPWPSVGDLCPHVTFPGGCSTVPSPAFHGDPQLSEKGSIPEFAGWNMGLSVFVVCTRIFFWFGKALCNVFLSKVPLEQFWLSWIQVLLKSVRVILCQLFQEICRHVSTPYQWISLEMWRYCSSSLMLATWIAF